MFPDDFVKREAYILQEVQAGRAEIHWAPIEVEENNHRATFFVSTDALKINGVRVCGTAKLQQQIGDVLNISLLTPKLADLRFQQAAIRLTPKPRGITNTTQAMLEQSSKIDADLVGQDVTDKIIDTVGKHWVLAEELRHEPKSRFGHPLACNYGFHFTGKDVTHYQGYAWFKGIKGYECDSKIKSEAGTIYVIQSSAISHAYSHSDYSQNFVYVRQDCLLDNQPYQLSQLLTCPTFAYLASHTGPVPGLRQPGVPIIS